ncbi:MAG: tryptophan synthase subunit alpha, partial [Actinomycetes bacterium]
MAEGIVEPGRLESALLARRASGGKCLVPYLTGGLGEWATMVGAAVHAGADAVEVGIPFSDPVMDGPVIQQANDQSLATGTTPATVLHDLARLDVGAPVAVM